MKAVCFDGYGGIDVLEVREVEVPVPATGEVLVQVKAAGINPGEAAIRMGVLHSRWPATFPSGEGSDLAGVIQELGDGVAGWSVGDEILGWTHRRASHAELAVVETGHLVRKPSNVPWEVAGSLFVAGATAWATVQAVGVEEGDTVVVSAAAGGVGSLSAQLARLRGATVIGLAGESNHAWLQSHGIVPVAYGEGAADRIRAVAGGTVGAFIDTFGGGYVELAIQLGVAPERIDTIIDYAAAATHGVKMDGNAAGATPAVLEELVTLISEGLLEVPIARVYPLAEVREAYRDLEQRHTRGKIVLRP